MFARCVYSDTVCFAVGELYSVDLLNGCKRGWWLIQNDDREVVVAFKQDE